MPDTGREDRERDAVQSTHTAHSDEDSSVTRFKQRYQVWRESIRRRPSLDRAYRIGVAIVGGAIVIGGFGLIPLPGPGWVIVFVGLAVLATEFVWAERTEKFARDQVSAWTAWLGRQPLVVRILVGLATFVFVLAILWLVFRVTGAPSWLPDSWVSAIPGITP